MTGTATAARVTNTRYFSNGVETARGDFVFNRAFRDEEARANKRFVTCPFVARGVAELANGSQERVDRQLRTVFPARFAFKPAYVQRGRFGRRFTGDLFG